MFTEELFLSSIYIAGLLSFFSPCIFPIIPVYLSILSSGEKKSLSKTIMFVLGLSVTFLILGFGAGFIGKLFFNERVRILGGIIIVFLGLFQMEVIKIKFLEKTKILNYENKDENIFSPFILGLTFSLGWTPCIGPILASILVVAGSSADILKSITMIMIYILGMATPFVIFSLASKMFLEKTKFIKKYLGLLKKIGGVLLVIMGFLLIFNKLNIFLTF